MKFLPVTFVFLFINFSAQNSVIFSKIDVKTEKIVNKFKNRYNIPGISLSVSYRGKLVYSKGFGYSNLEKKTNVSPSSTKFRIASISKTITALSLARLQEEGKLDFKESIYKYLDSLPKINGDIKVEDLLAHKSGLVRDFGENILCEKNNFHKKDFYTSFNTNRFQYKPGTNFSYSNYGYKLLGILLEKISGKTIIDAKKDLVINKIGLKNTIAETSNYDENTSKFYYKKDGKYLEVPCIDCSFNYGPGCYLSTSEDLVVLGNSYLYTNVLLPKDSFKNLLKVRNSEKDYGLGFMVKKDFYKNYFYGHNGSYPGAMSYLRIYPSNEFVISILMNYRDEKMIMEFEDLMSEIAYNYIEEVKKSKM